MCGAAELARVVGTELRTAGFRPRRSRLVGIDALTPSETRVAELAADGASNREIAQALFVTTKTVEVHLLLARLPWPEPPAGCGRRHARVARVRRTGSQGRLGAKFPAVCVAFVAVGAVFGCVQVGVFAATRNAGAPGAAGPVLAAFSMVSLVAGLIASGAAGAGGVRSGEDGGAGAGVSFRRYRRMLVVLVEGMLVPAPATLHPVLLAALLTVAASAASPAVAGGYAVAERLVPPARLVEGLGHAGAAVSLGLATGTAAAGLVADLAGGRAVFALGSAAGALGVLAALAVPVDKIDVS